MSFAIASSALARAAAASCFAFFSLASCRTSLKILCSRSSLQMMSGVGKVMAFTGQIVPQVLHPTMQLRGFTTTARLSRISYTPRPQVV